MEVRSQAFVDSWVNRRFFHLLVSETTRGLTRTFDYRLDNKDFTSTYDNFRRVLCFSENNLTWIWLDFFRERAFKDSRLDLRLLTWNAVCCSSFKHLNWALFSPGLTGVCQPPAAWSLDDSQPAGSDPVIDPVPQLSNCVALFSPPAKFLRQLSPQSHLSVSLLSGCLSVLPHSWQSSCPTNTVQAVLMTHLAEKV